MQSDETPVIGLVLRSDVVVKPQKIVVNAVKTFP
jgi:hypothetical protein